MAAFNHLKSLVFDQDLNTTLLMPIIFISPLISPLILCYIFWKLKTPSYVCLGGFSDLVYLTMGQLYSGACLIIKQLTCGDGLQVVVVK